MFRIPFFCTVSLLVGLLSAFQHLTATEPASDFKPFTEKTLVSWVYLANTTQRGGSALTIQTPAEEFDAIVFGEMVEGRWMAGSQFFARTLPAQKQAELPVEDADAKTLVQMAVTYGDDRITIYRNGEIYSQYPFNNSVLFDENSIVLVGLRHIAAGPPYAFAGDIEEVRIYNSALTQKDIKALKPHQPGPITPFAQWSFEKGEVEDACGRFTHSELRNGAKIVDDKLHLNGVAACLAAWRTEEAGQKVRQMATQDTSSRAPVDPRMKMVGDVSDEGENDVRDFHNFKERTYDLSPFLPADTLTVCIDNPYPGQGWGAQYSFVEFSSDGPVRDVTLPVFGTEETPYIFDQAGAGNNDGRRFMDSAGFFSYVFDVKGAKRAAFKIQVGNNFRISVGKNLPKPENYVSPAHFRPKVGVLADTIPFCWKGEYHIFYLHGGIGKVPWEHLVSTDLVHWKELPTALVSDGDSDGPDGEHMFTGSVIEKDGLFHIFYTGWNPRNPAGQEFIRHATSRDLIKWTKHPEESIGPDGVQYANTPRSRAFRDAFVFWNDEAGEYWMILCAESLKGGGPGVMISSDFKNWTPAPALKAPNQECPDLFKIGDTWYLIGGDTYSYSKDLHGDFKTPPVQNVIDRPAVYAGKRMFDGKRHVWTGWVWDGNKRDGGSMTWGGTQCLPRELYAGPDGQLYQRPVEEATAVFSKTVLGITKPRDIPPSLTLETPNHYMLLCSVQLDPSATLTITMRQQGDRTGGYNFVIRPDVQKAELNGPGFRYDRNCTLDTAKPIKFQAFVQGSIIECFINDQFAYTCRAYNYPAGNLSFEVQGGRARVLNLEIKKN